MSGTGAPNAETMDRATAMVVAENLVLTYSGNLLHTPGLEPNPEV